MADLKISALTGATTPLAGTEVLPIVQSGTTKQVSVANLTAGRAVSVSTLGVGVTTPVSIVEASSTTPVITASQSSTSVAINTLVGAFNAYSYDVSLNSKGGVGGVRVYSEVTWSTGGTPSYLAFYTHPDLPNNDTLLGAVVEAGRFDSSGNLKVNNGNLVIGTAGKGIDFSADGQAAGMTSELLDDYEEGTWTPVLGGSGGTSGQTYGTQAGTYTKIGNLVCAVFETTLSAKGTITTNAQIQGLPFSINAASNGGLAFSKIAFLSLVTTQLVGVLSVGGTVATLRQAGLNGDNTNLTTTNINDNTSIVGCFIYRT